MSSGRPKRATYWVEYRAIHREQHRIHMRNSRLRNKRKAIEKYGGMCANCGDSRLEVLTIDHVNGNGKSDRALDFGSTFYHRLLREPLREDLQVLCMNDNHAKGKNGELPVPRDAYGLAFV